ncbi:hypothetical protein Tco_1318369 [Tanacetum coccineum]
MDFVTKLPRRPQGYDTNLGDRSDRLYKSAIFTPMRETDPLDNLAGITFGYKFGLVCVHSPQTGRQSERTIQTLEDYVGACAIDFG